MFIMFSPLHLILCSSPLPCLCHANQHLNCRVVKQLELYVCVCRNLIPLNLDKLHCIIIVMSCMLAYDHAEYFAVVVSVHPLFAIALCFFSDRMLCGVVSIEKFSGCSSTILLGKLSHPLPSYRGTYYLFMFMLYALCWPCVPMLC
jgi:hypothetical protein